MKIIKLIVGQLQTNCYLLIHNNQAVIIDPGDDADLINQTLLEEKVVPLAMLATHGHFDHVMAGFELQVNFNIPFYLHSQDQFLLDRQQETARHYLDSAEIPPAVQKVTDLAKHLKPKKLFPNFAMQIIHTPGHTPGSVSFYFPKEKMLFSGDVLFAGGGRGRTDFAYCSYNDLQKSMDKLFELPKDTRVYGGHDKSMIIGEEKKLHHR